MPTPFDIVKHINEKTQLDFSENEYNPWIINRVFSNMIDTLFFADVMNKYYALPKDMQHDFYYYGLPKAKRFGKYHKVGEINIYVDLIMNKYQVNRKVAESYLRCMSEDGLAQLKLQMNRGGKNE